MKATAMQAAPAMPKMFDQYAMPSPPVSSLAHFAAAAKLAGGRGVLLARQRLCPVAARRAGTAPR